MTGFPLHHEEGAVAVGLARRDLRPQQLIILNALWKARARPLSHRSLIEIMYEKFVPPANAESVLRNGIAEVRQAIFGTGYSIQTVRERGYRLIDRINGDPRFPLVAG